MHIYQCPSCHRHIVHTQVALVQYSAASEATLKIHFQKQSCIDVFLLGISFIIYKYNELYGGKFQSAELISFIRSSVQFFSPLLPCFDKLTIFKSC